MFHVEQCDWTWEASGRKAWLELFHVEQSWLATSLRSSKTVSRGTKHREEEPDVPRGTPLFAPAPAPNNRQPCQ
jgi:hypothetical protein